MKTNTFGDSKKYKALNCITELVNKLEDRRKAKISTLISKFNIVCNKIKTVEDDFLLNYLIKSFKKDYVEKLDNLTKLNKYDVTLITHLANFFNAKLNNIKK